MKRGAPKRDEFAAGSEALEFHRRAVVADMHAHPLLPATYAGRDLARRGCPPRGWNPLRQHWDLPRAEEGGVDVQTWTVYVPLWPVRRTRPDREALRQIDLFERFARRHSDRVGIARDASDARRISSAGRMAFVLSVEGGHALGGRVEMVGEFARRGVWAITLVHFVPNGICDSSDVFWRGREPLTAFGREVVREMDRLGIVVDVAHMSDDAFREVAGLATGPLVSTHGGVRALCPIPRNLSDDSIRTIARTGGVVGIMPFPWYLERRGIDVGLSRLVDHIAHVAELVGAEHVGIGTDFDGFIWTVRGLSDVSELPNLTAELLRRGFAPAEVEGILGENFLRILDRKREDGRNTACA